MVASSKMLQPTTKSEAADIVQILFRSRLEEYIRGAIFLPSLLQGLFF
jgi:hypothetical protein